MSEFRIDREKTGAIENSLETIAKSAIRARIQLADIQKNLMMTNAGYQEIAACLEHEGDVIQEQAEAAASMQGALRLISRKYLFTEMQIIGILSLMSDDKFKIEGAWKHKGTDGQLAEGLNYDVNGSLLAGEAGVKTSGLGIEAYAKGHGATGSASLESEYAKASVTASAANVSASAKVALGTKASADKNGKTSYMIAGAEASAAANLAEGKVKLQAGTDKNNVHSEYSGSVVGADASAKAGVYSENGATVAKAKAEAEAYWAKGEVTQGFSIGGVKVDFTLEGMLGVQAEVGGEASLDGASAGVGLGPLGIKVKIDWSSLF